jgi:hypothetical protein
MSEILHRFDLGIFSPIEVSAASGLDNAILALRFVGTYGHGSRGNGDGIFMRASVAAYCAATNPICLVLDLLDLQYEWGNTISGAINFFKEFGRDESEYDQLVVIVARGKTREALEGLVRFLSGGRRVFCESVDEALIIARREVEEFLVDAVE